MIECRDLTKKYGELFAVERLSLKLEPGDVYGFIGPNGAGKTTTMRMLATLLNPSWGEATVCGHSIYTGSKEIRRAIGYMPDAFGVYDDMKVTEYLEFFAAAYRIQGADRKKKVEQVLDYVDLGYKRDALVTSLSRGMTQRLGLARVLLHDPQVLLLDEPASGLDPRARIEMQELIKRLRQERKTIMLSSHILPELAEICNVLGIIERGRLIFNGTVQQAEDEVRKVRGGSVFLISVGERNTEAAQKIGGWKEVSGAELSPKTGHIRVVLRAGLGDGSFIPERLIADRFKLYSFREEQINIQDIFLTITKGITS
ncbi:ABC transporter ATP-binding protein [Frigoriglobus tundricola]|uniref:Efflux ABC transporter, ATP-binding protein n=1 Tax=Frigoriglobus tundricola TaxID=2774151 RepID=A0A6M5YFF2_9BACT|nr:ABC transporter ATP-binding protein [Frigoriglobus tundricola]QJW92737.1 Efflux ABC transporter, ATP-binding protein [Frigoriglobus tundricola]